jgi:hypothetical protein
MDVSCWSGEHEKSNGNCPACGGETFDGEAVNNCFASPETCPVCHATPCDGSC